MSHLSRSILIVSIRRAIDHRLPPAAKTVQVEVVLEFDNIENIKRAVEIPSGIVNSSRAIPVAGNRGRHPGGDTHRVQRASSEPLTRPLAIVHRRQSSLEPAAAKFLELLTGKDVTVKLAAPMERVPATSSP